ncbi:unnamed protein product [Amoebophrya sp. A120]|nr:unnamed protein product [Amoebophrya sp. A120]|eukprot:GSA120T00019377001.1
MPFNKIKSFLRSLTANRGSASGKFSQSGSIQSNDQTGQQNAKEHQLQSKDEVDIRDVYDIGRILGSGSFGQVREARCRQGGDVRAVKIVEADDTDGEWSRQVVFVREVGLLQQLDHENIVKFYDFFEDPDFYYIVMEFYTGGELFQRILEVKRFSECDAAFLGFQMLLALEYIHSLRIVHRDVKAENFLFTSPGSIYNTPLKLIDFGMAVKRDTEVLHELCGSPHYLAPELIGQQYNHLVDLWALGVLLYLLLYGRYPYDAKDPQELMVKILTEKVEWRHPRAKIGDAAKQFLNCLLDRDVRTRYTSVKAMKQNWIVQNMLRVETHIKPVNKTNILALKYIQDLIRDGKRVMPLSRHGSKELAEPPDGAQQDKSGAKDSKSDNNRNKGDKKLNAPPPNAQSSNRGEREKQTSGSSSKGKDKVETKETTAVPASGAGGSTSSTAKAKDTTTAVEDKGATAAAGPTTATAAASQLAALSSPQESNASRVTGPSVPAMSEASASTKCLYPMRDDSSARETQEQPPSSVPSKVTQVEPGIAGCENKEEETRTYGDKEKQYQKDEKQAAADYMAELTANAKRKSLALLELNKAQKDLQSGANKAGAENSAIGGSLQYNVDPNQLLIGGTMSSSSTSQQTPALPANKVVATTAAQKSGAAADVNATLLKDHEPGAKAEKLKDGEKSAKEPPDDTTSQIDKQGPALVLEEKEQQPEAEPEAALHTQQHEHPGTATPPAAAAESPTGTGVLQIDQKKLDEQSPSVSKKSSEKSEDSDEEESDRDQVHFDETFDYEPIAIPKEVLHMARRSSIATRKLVDTSFETMRNQKLEFIQNEYKRGLRYGHRMGGGLTPSPSEAAYSGSFIGGGVGVQNNASFYNQPVGDHSGSNASELNKSTTSTATGSTTGRSKSTLFKNITRRVSTLFGIGEENVQTLRASQEEKAQKSLEQKAARHSQQGAVPGKRSSKGPDVATRMSQYNNVGLPPASTGTPELQREGSIFMKPTPAGPKGSTSFFMQQNSLSMVIPQHQLTNEGNLASSPSTVLPNGATVGASSLAAKLLEARGQGIGGAAGSGGSLATVVPVSSCSPELEHNFPSAATTGGGDQVSGGNKKPVLKRGATSGNVPTANTPAKAVPRRLSYIGALAPGQEQSLASMFAKQHVPETIPEALRESTQSTKLTGH